MARTRRVVFGRINRRNSTLAMRPFAEDLRALAESRLTTYVAAATAERPEATWYAADMRVEGAFMVGVLGFSVNEEKRYFDPEAWSWIKGSTEASDAASQDTVVPFAVDLRDKYRLFAHTTTSRVRDAGFRSNLGKVLTQASVNAGLIAADWECDPVVSKGAIREWIRRFPRIKLMRRDIRFNNPGLNLDEERAEMRALGARRKTEEIAAFPNQTLNAESAAFEQKLDGVDRGDVDIYLESRVNQDAEAKFDSKDRPDEIYIDDYGTDLERGMDSVLRVLSDYVGSLPADFAS